jgi:hypothetical protein
MTSSPEYPNTAVVQERDLKTNFKKMVVFLKVEINKFLEIQEGQVKKNVYQKDMNKTVKHLKVLIETIKKTLSHSYK